MVLKKLAIAIILLATFTVPEFARIRYKHLAESTAPSYSILLDALDAADAQALKDEATSPIDGAEFNSASPPVAALESTAVDPDDPSSDFSRTLDYLKRANGWHRRIILMAACESSAFSCEEIIKFVDFSSGEWEDSRLGYARRWVIFARLFVEGRENKGCISDPANAKHIVGSFENMWRDTQWPSVPIALSIKVELGGLKQVFIDNESLKPARNIRPPHVQLQIGLRTDEHMKKLVVDMKELFPRFLGGTSFLLKFTSWLKQIRSSGEQFSGPQLVTLTHAITQNGRTGAPQAVSYLLHCLKQYVTGVTCKEVNQILERMVKPHRDPYFFEGLYALKPNIIDGQNKVAIVAADNVLDVDRYADVADTEKAIRDVSGGVPPQNNPIFGVVQGNPVIFVVDESTSMDASFTLGDDTLTRRKFCHSQLETVIEGLPNGTYFNVIRYSVSAVKLFKKIVLVSKTNIDKAMEPVSWRGGYKTGQDPTEMLRDIKMSALEFKHKFHRSIKKSSMEALKLAYGMAHEALPGDLPQIYFLTSGQPDGGARQILDKINELDSGRNIPVNSISWIMPADPEAKQFVKDLANKTGGFFRPIEQAS